MDRPDVGDIAEMLLDYVENDRTYQADRVITVPTASYFDADVWQREVDTVFRQVPLMLALTCEMPNPGDYKAMSALDLPILIARDKAGVAHAFLNVCSHRGAPVAAEGHGHCARFTCQYHSWSFGLDGRLLAVADSHKFGDLDKAGRGLRALPCEERAGMIFVVLTPGAVIDLDAYFQGMLADFEAAGLARWSFLGSRVIRGANWKIAFDGYLEGYHFASLHPTTIHPRTPSNVTHYEGFGPHMRIGFPQVTIADQLGRVPREAWANEENRGFDFVRILFPNVSAFLAPELAQIAQLFPGPTPEENVTILLYARKEAPENDADRAKIEETIDFLRDVTNDEDYRLGLDMQKGLKTGAFDTIVFGRNERGNQFFHETLQWYMNGRAGPVPVL